MNLEVGHPSVLVAQFAGSAPGAFGVDERSVVVQVGQQSGAGLHPIFAGQTQIRDRRAVLGIVLSSPLQCILQVIVSGAPLAGVALAPWVCADNGTCAKLECPSASRTKMGNKLFAQLSNMGRASRSPHSGFF